MTIQEPAWRKRTRPCPFFSQGRCLFADSCNFLHEVKVKNVVEQPLLSTLQTKQEHPPPKLVFDPPSVVVNSASPRSANLAGPESRASSAQDSLRYSGLLSVLSDIIGPPLTTAEDIDPQTRTTPPIPTNSQGRAHSYANAPSESNSVPITFQPGDAIVDAESAQGTSGNVELSSILRPNGGDTLADPFAFHMGPFFPEALSPFVAENLTFLDPEESSDRNTASYPIEDTGTVTDSPKEGEDDEDLNDFDDENPTVVLSNRQSTLSSFTGASLLASPRNSVFTDASVASLNEDGTVDLLSPVELSVKLQPFPIPSLASKIRRGDSIDSGYADGDSWASPPSFPRTPPSNSRSSAILLPHLRRGSRSSTALRGPSCGAGSLRPFPHNPIEAIKEVESDGGSVANDGTYTILDAYDRSRPEVHEAQQVNATVVTEDQAEEGDQSEVPAVIRSPRQFCPEHLHPITEYDLDSCNQSSFVSDDNVSFKTALSTQTSYEDISNISKASSNLSSVLGYSVHSTSVLMLSHFDDATELLEYPIIGSDPCDSSHFLATKSMKSQIDDGVVSEALASQSPLGRVVIDSDALSISIAADDLQGCVSEKADAPRVHESGVSQSERRSSKISLLVDGSHCLSPDNDTPLSTNDLRQLASERVIAPQERFSGAFNFDDHSSTSSLAKVLRSPPARVILELAFSGTDDPQESALENVVASQERILPHDRCSPKLGPSTESSYNPSLCSAILRCTAAGANDLQGFTLANDTQCADGEHSDAVFPQERSFGVFPFTERHRTPSSESSRSPSSTRSIPNYTFSSDVQDSSSVVLVPSKESLPSVLRFGDPPPKSFPESPRSSPSVRDIVSSASLGTDRDDRGSPEPIILDSDLSGYIAGVVDQSFAEDTLASEETTASVGLEGNSFARPLSFLLPLPFPPVEVVGHSTLTCADGASARPEAIVTSQKRGVSEVRTTPQGIELQWIRSGSDLTERARPSQLPSFGSLDATIDFNSRSRAASDLTVKGRSSPVTFHEDPSCALESVPSLLEESGQSDRVQSLYDRYFDDGTYHSASEFSRPVQEDMVPGDTSSSTEGASQDPHRRSLGPTFYAFESISPQSDGKSDNSGTNSSPSGSSFRPFLSGRRSLLRSTLAEPIPKVNLGNAKESSPTHRHARLQAREIGSTMVPLGFHRYKSQPATTQPLWSASQPLPGALPASELRQALRIRTDIAKEDSSRGCSSAILVSSAAQSPLLVKSMSAPPTGGLKELRLSSILNKRSSILSTHSSSVASSILSLDHIFNSSTPQSPSVSSASSFSCNSLLSSSREQIPNQAYHTLKRSNSSALIQQTANDVYFSPQSPLIRRDSRTVSSPIQQPKSWRLSHYRAGSRNFSLTDVARRFSKRTSTLSLSYVVGEEQDNDEEGSTTIGPIQSRQTDEWINPGSAVAAPVHAIATPKPTLLFAIASDDVNQVNQVLESGEASPNDSVGPQSALAFTLTNDKLMHKQEIVKALLAYGANPSALRNPTLNPALHKVGGDKLNAPPPETTLEGMDPATRYFVSRADAPHTRQTSQLIYRSFFRPLTRVRYDVIGQDWALEQLFRVLGMHSQKLAVAPIVVLLCGPSGHGKSLLARKFGSLLGIPTHTVNMTTLRSAYDIWQSYSMSPYEEPSSCTLTEFLIENEGKRCVVVLDEIEKVEDQKVLWSLLMPWELGRCSWEAGKRHVDLCNVIWLGTSNIGHDLVFEHHESRAESDNRMSREDYLKLTNTLRPRVSHCLGASLVSRVTTVLPFVPFTLEEKKAIAAEAIYAFGGDRACKLISPQGVESMVMKALLSYRPSEGARSLHRAVSNILVDTDPIV